MNENPPPPGTLKPWKATGIGALLFAASLALCFCFSHPFFLLAGFVGAFVSLFIKGYRWIFLGYILSVGLVLLVAIAYCSIYPVNFH